MDALLRAQQEYGHLASSPVTPTVPPGTGGSHSMGRAHLSTGSSPTDVVDTSPYEEDYEALEAEFQREEEEALRRQRQQEIEMLRASADSEVAGVNGLRGLRKTRPAHRQVKLHPDEVMGGRGERRARTSLALRPSGVAQPKGFHRPSSARNELGGRAVDAKKHAKAASEEEHYWNNRVKLLKMQVEKQEAKLGNLREKNAQVEDDNIRRLHAAADKEEEDRRLKLDAEGRKELVRQRRLEDLKTREAIRQKQEEQLLLNKQKATVTRAEVENQRRIEEFLRYEELENNLRKKEAIQQARQAALLKRVKDRATVQETAHARYQKTIQEKVEEDKLKSTETVDLIDESTKLLTKLKALKSDQQVGFCWTSQRSRLFHTLSLQVEVQRGTILHQLFAFNKNV
eukprot:NODE_1823_length_1289_cov_15.359677_g1509_i0.p1 GENE.NODE_1823_length_1289_cov_15.359677_g1509_i0~~NODE_1823_length_1289_cov_15.359677_g1509_i0.p1  ORF type:complete len:420 (+),score=114.04 NODE_1823_length_1289_cov_15.359677_g1509_i0:63-1262(+)